MLIRRRAALGPLALICCLAGEPAAAEIPTLRLVPISEGEIVSPVAIANPGDGSERLFVADQRGTIHVIDEGVVLATPFLDVGSKLVPERSFSDERGLLGLAFDPDFGQAGSEGGDKFYVYYSAPRPGGDPNDPIDPVDHQSVIAEYAVVALDANVADPNSERILLTFDQPQLNHNAGYLGFGPDGMLYVTTGDGGGGGDNEPGHTGGGAGNPSGGLGNAQDLTRLLGKVLRIDPRGSDGPGGQYGIPSDNPFAAPAREEIYAYGLRNPWRASFDDGPGGTGRLFLADVGQGDVEEIDLIESGGNYGWRIREGSFDFDPTVPNASPLLDPIAEYAHPGSMLGIPEIGISVTGGAVYRGSLSPLLEGVYLFGDFSTTFGSPSGTLLALEEAGPGSFDLSIPDVEGGNPISGYILAFGMDEDGEVYVATKQTLGPSEVGPNGPTGAIYRIEAPEPSAGIQAVGAWTMLAILSWFRRRARRGSDGGRALGLRSLGTGR